MTVERMEQLYELLKEFRDEFTDRRKHGEDNPIVLNHVERNALDSAQEVVFEYKMEHKYPEQFRRNDRHENLPRQASD